MRFQDLEAQECKNGRLKQLNKLIKLFQESTSDLQVCELADEVGGMLVVLGQ